MSKELVAEFAAVWPVRARQLPRWALVIRPPVGALLQLLERAELAHARADDTLWYAERCPACSDSSLWIREGFSGVILTCWNACAAESIVDALELEAAGANAR